jgi:hypothetical protein
MSYRLGISGTLAAVILSVLAFQSKAAAEPAQNSWLAISSFTITERAGGGKDTFVMRGHFDLNPGSVNQAVDDLTLTIGTKQFALTHDLWHRVGGSDKYRASADNLSVRIDYWVGKSHRCNFTFIGSKQTISSYIADPAAFDVALQVASQVDMNTRVIMNVKTARGTTTAKLSAYSSTILAASDPAFVLESLHITRNLKKRGDDSIVITGRTSNVPYDPTRCAFGICLFSTKLTDIFRSTIPGYELTLSSDGSEMTYDGPLYTPSSTPFGHCSLVGTADGHATITITGVDLKAMTNPAVFFLGVIGDSFAYVYEFKVKFHVNAAHTSYKY